MLDAIATHRFEDRGLTEFAQAIPEQYKVPGDAVLAYRQFYLGEKMHFSRRTRRRIPRWAHDPRLAASSVT